MADMPKQRQSRRLQSVLYLPTEILDEINSQIDNGWRSAHITNIIHKKYGTQKDVQLPSQSTIERYIKFYLEKQSKEIPDNNLLVTEVQKDINEIQNLVNNPDPKISKRAILEGVIQKSIDRISEIERTQKGRVSPGFESCITRYLTVLREVTETLARYEGEMPTDNSVIVNIVDNNVQTLLRIVHKVVQELAPDKVKDFQKRLKEEIDLYRREITTEKIGGEKK